MTDVSVDLSEYTGPAVEIGEWRVAYIDLAGNPMFGTPRRVERPVCELLARWRQECPGAWMEHRRVGVSEWARADDAAEEEAAA